jgi:uncharacterized membrane protein
MININALSIVGILLIVYSIIVFIIPPKFMNGTFGIKTKMTSINEEIWYSGQRLLAISLIILGLIFGIMGLFKIQEKYMYIVLAILLIASWFRIKNVIDIILEKRYPNFK